MENAINPNQTKSTKKRQKLSFVNKNSIVLVSSADYFLKIAVMFLLTFQLSANKGFLNRKLDLNVSHVKKAATLVLLRSNVRNVPRALKYQLSI